MLNNDKIKNEFQAHKKFHKIFFSNNDMDFSLQWLLGSTSHGGCTIGEVFYAASRMRDGDPVSWEKELTKLAERVEKRGSDMLINHHTISARDQYLRAYCYYRAVLATLNPNDSVFKKLANKAVECFRIAAKLFNPPIEKFEILFEGKKLPGYFMKCSNDDRARKTIIMIGGGETFVEDQYYYIAPAAIKRGYNFLSVDLPGQGTTPFDGLYFRNDIEVPMKHVVDYALSRKDVDGEKLAAYGISAGGYLVPRAVQHDKRLKACIANSAIVNMYKLLKSSIVKRIEQLKKRDPFFIRMMNLIAWRWGLDPDKPYDFINKNKDLVFEPSKIDCPMMILIGEGEYNSSEEIKTQQHYCFNHLPNPQKKLVIAPSNEGAGHHCLGENLPLMSAIVFNWLDEIF